MDAKVIVEVTCPYCHSKIMMKKKVGLSSMTIKCPQNDCGKELNIIFDTNKNPQTYKFIYESKDRGKKKTIYKNQSDKEENEFDNQRGKTIYGKDKHKTPNHHYDDLDEEEEVVTPKKHHRLRDRIYLTHIMWFGLRNQKYQLFEGTTTIGRYDEIDISDIMIRGDETMSRKSAAIIIEEEDGIYDYKLKVLNATNKVTVNNQRIKEGSETYLDFGDIIILGNSKFNICSKITFSGIFLSSLFKRFDFISFIPFKKTIAFL
jgi:hypothetical protein